MVFTNLRLWTGKSHFHHLNALPKKVVTVTELICSKDYVIIRLFESVTYQVFSIAKRAIIHLLHVGLAPVGSRQLDQVPLYDKNHFSSVKGKAKCAKKIQDGNFIHTQVTAVGVDMEHQNKFQFLSWNLPVPQLQRPSATKTLSTQP